MSDSSLDVAHVCALAHFDLSPEEMAMFQRELGPIVAYVNKLSELDLTGIEPTQYGQPVANVLREDVVEPSLDRETALANAPARTGDEFMLPKIVEGAES
jgi:aspartyl-tRNA(Asn)/glutamyl-tRNA(Gln) amidotransferase subunit C